MRKEEKQNIGQCTSKERALQVITEEIQDHLPEEKWEEYEHVVNRIRCEFAKTDRTKPKYHKGHSFKDWYTCGYCGFIIREIGHNFCPNCGHGIKWDGIRCLTK